MQANKKSAHVLIQAGDAVSKPQKTGMMLTGSGDLGPNGHGPIQYGWILKKLYMKSLMSQEESGIEYPVF